MDGSKKDIDQSILDHMALYRFTKKNGKIRINNVSKNVMLHQTRISCPMGNTQVQGHRLW